MSETQASIEERLEAHFSPTDVSEDVEQELPEETETEELEASDESQDDSEGTESVEEEAAPVESEEVEIEWEGNSVKLPAEFKGLKDALMAQSDYTQKTQETARLREALTLQQKEVELFQENRAFEDSISSESDNLKLLDAYIQHESTNTDWAQLNTDQIVRKRLEIDQLRDQREALAKDIEGKRKEFNERLATERKKLTESYNEVLSKSIPNWGDEVRTGIEKSLIEMGYPEQSVKHMSALDYKVAWEASQYRKIKSGQKPKDKPLPVVKTGASNPMPKDVKEKLGFKKQLDKAKKANLPEGQQAKIIEQRLEQKLRNM